jgi:NADH-quinone oxidoreductase subunit D/NADH-quinone oxidoreductase subunit C/D
MEETVVDIDLQQKQEYVVNIGPQHPSTHGVLRLETRLQGEVVKSITPHCGYIHRGIEKMSEKLSYPQLVHLTDRMDYLAAHINNEAVALCVENAMEVQVSDRVKYIRTILAELTRIASHQLWWAAFGMDLGALTTFFYGLRDREKILDIFEETTGSRLIQSYITPGGLMNDIHPNFQRNVKEFIKYFRKKLPEYDELLTNNVIFRERTRNIGVLSKEEAIDYAVTGPSGRGSGFECDIRKIEPYSAYPFVTFKEILETKGDTFARYCVRVREMYESLSIIEQLIDNIPAGATMLELKAVKAPKGEFYQRVETPRGELGVFIISDGGPAPARIKYRSPNFSNLFVLQKIAVGHKIADLVAISGSLDLVIPDIDR